MTTDVVMKRQILGGEVSQKMQSGYFSATEFEKIANHWRALNNLEPYVMRFIK